tara:strand:+ start:226 stop:504 length:279 start_codon:yes stop_codon:yes gene_type:complete
MDSDKKPIYVGSGKIVNGQYGPFRNATLNLDKAKAHIYKCKFTNANLLNLVISDKKETDQFGKNVSVAINEYKPEIQEDKGQIVDDLPFDVN